MGKVSAAQAVIFLGPLAADRQQVIDQIHIRQMQVHMVAGKSRPERLLRVVVHVIIAVPRNANLPVAPIRKETRTGDAGAQGTAQKVKIPIPDAFQEIIG